VNAAVRNLHAHAIRSQFKGSSEEDHKRNRESVACWRIQTADWHEQYSEKAGNVNNKIFIAENQVTNGRLLRPDVTDWLGDARAAEY
jgi:hypothetical protein